MYAKLHKHLTFICILCTSSILLIIGLISLFISESALHSKTKISLDNDALSIIGQLQSSHCISHAWLAEYETSHDLVISIATSKRNFLFPGSYKPSVGREHLIDTACEIANSQYSFNLLSQYASHSQAPLIVSFPFSLKGNSFYATLATISTQNMQYKITLIKDLSNEKLTVIWLRIAFIMIDGIGILLLSYFSWVFTKKAVKPIVLAHQEQNDFVAAASHELRSPVAVIQAVLEDLLKQHSSSSETQKSLTIVYDECKNLSSLINDLFLLAGADAKKWSLHQTETELDNLLIDSYDHFLPLAQDHEHQLLLELPDTVVPSLYIDPQRIEQVMAILINNALTYSPPHTDIIIRLKSLPHALEIDVIDHGPGIPLEMQHKVFNRFFRVDSLVGSEHHHGLGLSIAYEIIQNHGGKLMLLDNQPTGCIFRITFTLPKTKTKHSK